MHLTLAPQPSRTVRCWAYSSVASGVMSMRVDLLARPAVHLRHAGTAVEHVHVTWLFALQNGRCK